MQKSGAWYSYGEERLGQGRENVRTYLKENPELAREIEDKIRQACELPPLDPDSAAENSAEKDEKS